MRVGGRRDNGDTDDNRKVSEELEQACAIGRSFKGEGKGDNETARARRGPKRSCGRKRERESRIGRERSGQGRERTWRR